MRWDGKTWFTFLICLFGICLLLVGRDPVTGIGDPVVGGTGGLIIGLAVLWLKGQKKP